VAGVRWSELDGINEVIERVVVGADGFYSALARFLEPADETQFPVRRYMYDTCFQGIEPLEEAAFIGLSQR
jgi:2-polyprenyl-6-methoxyphenol hydroxylase-like FAD-dependent oxidoreductase